MTLPAAILRQQKPYVYLYIDVSICAWGTADKLNWLFKTPDSFSLESLQLI